MKFGVGCIYHTLSSKFIFFVVAFVVFVVVVVIGAIPPTYSMQ